MKTPARTRAASLARPFVARAFCARRLSSERGRHLERPLLWFVAALAVLGLSWGKLLTAAPERLGRPVAQHARQHRVGHVILETLSQRGFADAGTQ